MNADKITVGSDKIKLSHVVGNVELPSDLGEMFSQYKIVVPQQVGDWLAKLPEGVRDGILRTHVRGMRIEKQERSGARAFVESNAEAIRKGEASVIAKLETMVRDFMPGTSATVGRPKVTPTITLKADKSGKLSAEEAIAALKAAGINVNLQ